MKKPWSPKPDELLAAGAITQIVSGDEFAASGVATEAAGIEADLLGQRLFRVIREREPEQFAALVAKLEQGVDQGVAVEDLRGYALRWTTGLRTKYVPYAEDGAVLALFRLVMAEVDSVATTSKAGCVAILSGGDSAQKAIQLIPIELRRQEAEVMADVFATADSARPLPDRAKTDALFETVLARMGADAELLDRVGDPALDAETGCRVLSTLYRQALELAPEDSAALLKSWSLH